MKISKDNTSLILGLSIPFLMILMIMISILVPKMFNQPLVNFVYMTGDDYTYQSGQKYIVTDGKIVENVRVNENHPAQERVKIYLYDVSSKKSTLVEESALTKFILDPNEKSLDGYSVIRSGGGGSFFFGPSDYNARYLSGHGLGEKINIPESEKPFTFRFLGWVK